MAELLLFHHVHGRTPGVEAFAKTLDTTDQAELFFYPGDQHLFTDSSLASYDAAATQLLVERMLAFLDRV